MYPAGEAVLRGGRKNLWPTTVAKRRTNRQCVLGLPLKATRNAEPALDLDRDGSGRRPGRSGEGRVFVARQDGRKPQIVAGQPPRPAEGTAATAASRLPGWIVLSWACEAAGKPSLWLFRPGGTQLLCARRESSGARTQLLLMDDRFRVTGQLFSLDVPSWHPEDREFGNLAGWAVVPADVPLPNAG